MKIINVPITYSEADLMVDTLFDEGKNITMIVPMTDGELVEIVLMNNEQQEKLACEEVKND